METNKKGYAPVASGAESKLTSKSSDADSVDVELGEKKALAQTDDDTKKAGVEGGEKKSDGKNELKNATSLSFIELMRVLKPFFWPDGGTDSAIVNRFRAIATWLSVAASKGCSLAAPFFLLDATNQLIAGDYDRASVNIATFVAFGLGRSFFKEIQGALYVKVKQAALVQLQRYAFGHLHSLSLGWHLSKKTGAVIKSMDRGIDATNTLVSSMFLWLVPALCECVAVMILFFTKFTDVWLVGLTIGISISIYILITVIITIWRKKFRKQMNKKDNEYHDISTDSIVNFETVKYFAAEDYEVNRYTKSVAKYQEFSAVTLISMQLLNFVQQFILHACLVACLLISGKAVTDGRMTIGGWVAIQTWIMAIFQPLNFLGSIYNSIIQALVDVKNLSDLLSEKPDIVDAPDSTDIPYFTTAGKGSRLRATSDANKESNHVIEGSTPVQSADGEKSPVSPDHNDGVSLEFDNVYFHYPSQPPERGLKGVNFTVPAGSTTAIVGSTGAGKTTVSRLLFRFYAPLKGSVKFGGYDIAKCTQHSVRSIIGVVPQDTVMFNETIMYNIRYGRLDATDEEVYQAAEAAQIRHFVESLPDSWRTTVGERGLKLSGGEKQRVAIARCLLKNPPVVVLDEATSALDTVTENSVQEALDTLGVNRTVVIIAHRLSTIRHADQILAMENGLVKESGTHEELLLIEGGIYKKLWDMQARTDNTVQAVQEVTAEAEAITLVEAAV